MNQGNPVTGVNTPTSTPAGTGGTDSQSDRTPTITPEQAVATALAAHSGARPTDVTLKDAHNMLVAFAILVAFVLGLTMLAGMSTDAGQFCAGLMLLLLLLQGIGHVNPFVQWVANHPLTPER